MPFDQLIAVRVVLSVEVVESSVNMEHINVVPDIPVVLAQPNPLQLGDVVDQSCTVAENHYEDLELLPFEVPVDVDCVHVNIESN